MTWIDVDIVVFLILAFFGFETFVLKLAEFVFWVINLRRALEFSPVYTGVTIDGVTLVIEITVSFKLPFFSRLKFREELANEVNRLLIATAVDDCERYNADILKRTALVPTSTIRELRTIAAKYKSKLGDIEYIARQQY